MIADSSKIALIIPYFGTSPLYYPYWLYSASLNPSIDFHLFTDHLENSINAANIVIHRTNFLDFIARLQATLGVKINGLGPYKLCDLRPAFGYVLKDELCAYDFWGYCDIDVILGDIRRFLPNDMSQYDKLFEHGHFTLIRNSQDCRDNFQKQIPGLCSFRDVFENPGNFCFDEADLSKHYWKDLQVFGNDGIFYDISPKYTAFSSSRRNVSHRIPQLFQYTQGRLFWHSLDSAQNLQTKEMGYVHFQGRIFQKYCASVSDFLLTPQGFMDSVEITKELLLNMGSTRGVLPYSSAWVSKEWKRYRNKILYETLGILKGVYIVPKRKYYVPC